MKKGKKIKKVRVYYLDLRKKFKGIFVEKKAVTTDDIFYYFSQFFHHAQSFKRIKFKIIIPLIDDPILHKAVSSVVYENRYPSNVTIKWKGV